MGCPCLSLTHTVSLSHTHSHILAISLSRSLTILPPPSPVIRKDSIGAVESVKAASDVYAPVSGEIVEVNAALQDKPTLINESPEGDGMSLA